MQMVSEHENVFNIISYRKIQVENITEYLYTHPRKAKI